MKRITPILVLLLAITVVMASGFASDARAAGPDSDTADGVVTDTTSGGGSGASGNTAGVDADPDDDAKPGDPGGGGDGFGVVGSDGVESIVLGSNGTLEEYILGLMSMMQLAF